MSEPPPQRSRVSSRSNRSHLQSTLPFARVEILLNEKSSTVAERQQLLLSIKQTLGYLGVLVGILLDRGFASSGTEAAFVVVPFVVLAGLAYMYSNTLTLLVLTAHLERVDMLLAAGTNGETALWHKDQAAPIARWGVVVQRRRSRVLNPYYALAMTIGTIGVGACAVSMVRAWYYIAERFGDWLAWSVEGLVLVELVLVVHGFGVSVADPLDH